MTEIAQPSARQTPEERQNSAKQLHQYLIDTFGIGKRRRRRIGVCNQKGGAGKTTTVVGIAAALARRGKRARIHDMDPQLASVTFWLPPQWDDVPEDRRYTMKHVMAGECTLDQATWPTTVPGLYIVPSDQTLTAWANGNPAGGEFALREAIEESTEEFDAELIDAAPSLGILTIAALTATEELLIPLRAAGLDFVAVGELTKTLAVVRKRLNDQLTVIGFILCGKLESKLVGQIHEQLRKDFPAAFTHEIRNTVRVGEAQFAQQPLHLYAPGCTADVDYQDLTTGLYGEERAA